MAFERSTQVLGSWTTSEAPPAVPEVVTTSKPPARTSSAMRGRCANTAEVRRQSEQATLRSACERVPRCEQWFAQGIAAKHVSTELAGNM
eukprot:scaffold32663_cov30-Tisochrysis_lutea.AAC.5